MFKKLTFVFLAVLLFGGSVLAFAWWDNPDENEAGTLELGYGVRLELDESSTSDGRILVPAGSFYAAYAADYTTAYTYTYVLQLEEPLKAGMLANLVTEITNFTVDGDEYDNDPQVFTVTIEVGTENSTTLDLTVEDAFTESINQVTVTVTVELESQSNTTLTDAEYDEVAGKTFGFNIEFSLVNNGSSVPE